MYRTGEAIGLKRKSDWSGVIGLLPEVVLLPETSQQVADVLRLCSAFKQPVVMQGGLTGLSGGASPQKGEWVLSLDRMRAIIELDLDALTITVEAGITLQEIHEAVHDHNLQFPINMGSRGSCTAGGIVATNAGGTQVIQRGMARALVLGLQVVLPDGTILQNQNKLLKNNAGYDLKQLFIGAEGTLGVITTITFRLFPEQPARQTALCALNSFPSVIALLHTVQRQLSGLSAFEVMWDAYFHTTSILTEQRHPFSDTYPFYALIESEGVDDKQMQSSFEDMLEQAFGKGVIQDAVIARNEEERSGFWRVRDGVSELFPHYNPVANFDIGIPVSSMERYARNVEQALKDAFPECHVFIFGHIGDGNLHLLASTGNAEDVHRIEEIVFDHARIVQGTITAEHGIGVTKKEWLHYCRTPEEIATMRQLKQLFDPAQILNPGRIFEV